jgi:hydroxymethylpyrimidine kinase/phosphomethylpyrimidine kinase
MLNRVLISLAGFDPTAGAGVTLDLNVFSKHGFYGMGLCTALTVQNTREARKWRCIPSDMVLEQYRCLDEDMEIQGLKIGMLGCQEHIHTVSSILDSRPDVPVVVDPVFRSSSGLWLLEKHAIGAYLTALAGRIQLITPNLEEASWITGRTVAGMHEMRNAARKIYQEYAIPSLIKGGHLSGQATDLLYDGQSFHVFKKEKVKAHVHGTGCFFSSSVLCLIVQGNSLDEACRLAGEDTKKAIQGAVQVGKGQKLMSLHF